MNELNFENYNDLNIYIYSTYIKIFQKLPIYIMDGLQKEYIAINKDKCIIYVNNNGLLDNKLGPAVNDNDLYYMYCNNGFVHRDDGPAILDLINKKMIFYKNGYLKRDNGPVIIEFNNNYIYFENNYDLKEKILKYPKSVIYSIKDDNIEYFLEYIYQKNDDLKSLLLSNEYINYEDRFDDQNYPKLITTKNNIIFSYYKNNQLSRDIYPSFFEIVKAKKYINEGENTANELEGYGVSMIRTKDGYLHSDNLPAKIKSFLDEYHLYYYNNAIFNNKKGPSGISKDTLTWKYDYNKNRILKNYPYTIKFDNYYNKEYNIEFKYQDNELKNKNLINISINYNNKYKKGNLKMEFIERENYLRNKKIIQMNYNLSNDKVKYKKIKQK